MANSEATQRVIQSSVAPYLRMRAPALFPGTSIRQESLIGVAGGLAASQEAARHCAFLALEALDAGAGLRAMIPKTAERIVWPAGFVGCVTFADSFATAAVARSHSVRAIGIDSETVFSPDMAEAIQHTFLHPDEWDVLRLADDLAQVHKLDPRALRVSIAFAIKECLWRCLSPLSTRVFDLLAVRIESLEESGTWTASLLEDLDPIAPQGAKFSGQFVCAPPYVHASTYIRARDL